MSLNSPVLHVFFPAWLHKSPSAYTYHITASMPFGNYMSSPLVLFPSDVTCPSHWFCSLRMLHVLSSASVPFGNSADHCFSSSPHTVSASSQVLIRYIFTFLSVFFIKPLRVFPGPISTKVSIPCAIIALMLCSQ